MNAIPKFTNLENQQDFSQPLENLFSDIIATDTTGDGVGTDNMTAIIIYFTMNIN